MVNSYDVSYLKHVLEQNRDVVFMSGSSRAKEVIVKDFCAGDKYLIYGAGRIGREIRAVLEACQQDVIGFLDKNAEKIQKEIYGCYKPEEFIRKASEEVVVIIGIFLSDEEVLELKHYLKQIGYTNVVYNKNLIASFCPFAEKQVNPEAVWNQREEIIESFSLLADDISRKTFIDNLKAYMTWDFNNLTECENMMTYFEVKVPFAKGYGNFVDCGAYTGDSFLELIERHKCKTYIAFEPDLLNFKDLANTMDLNVKKVEEVLLYPCAVSDENGYLSFDDGAGVGSCLSEEKDKGSTTVSVVKIDTVLKKKEIDFIKMDIEGAERDALNGAKEIIAEQKPDLAICVYHRISDLWKIALQLKTMCSEYKFYLRCHGTVTVETVLYATIGK